jgi:hypothetical protein
MEQADKIIKNAFFSHSGYDWANSPEITCHTD